MISWSGIRRALVLVPAALAAGCATYGKAPEEAVLERREGRPQPVKVKRKVLKRIKLIDITLVTAELHWNKYENN